DPELRKKFMGKPEHVINFMFFVAEEVREIMAELGVYKFEDLIGHSELLEFGDLSDHWKAKNIDLSPILYRPEPKIGDGALHNITNQDHGLAKSLDQKVLIEAARPALERGEKVVKEFAIKNTNRTVGT